jgi:hypothetical protein
MMNPYGWFKDAHDAALSHAHERIRELEAALEDRNNEPGQAALDAAKEG